VTGRVRPLVVVATEAEAEHVPAGLRLVITGIGKTAAAVATTRAVLQERPSLVVNVGSAGALRDGLTGLLEIGEVVNSDMNGDAIRALGYDPQDRIDLGPAKTVLASGDVFVTDPEVRARLASYAHLVDMEGYAVAYAARHLGVPVTMVKHVSDNADDSALEWADVVSASALALGQWLAAQDW
jgi:adenosylhomocysteine nucleosidase